MTRRDLLAAATALLHTRAAFAKASQPTVSVNFAIPPGACDCHTHIFADPAKFPLSPARTYTPETASPEEMSDLRRALHIDRVVIVTPSIYGADNSATLYGIRARGASACGVAVIDEKTSDRDLDALDAAGFRGIRINLATVGRNDPVEARQRFQAEAERMKRRRWHIQMYTSLAIISAIKDLVQTSPVPVVFDHFGGAQTALGLEQPGFKDLLDLVHSGKAYVKISGAYRASTLAPDYPDVAPFARALIAANPQRILWGSDWPHSDSTASPNRRATDLAPLIQVDDARLLNQFAMWVPDPPLRKQILVDNPARLYRF
jgi:predicted TIM-barrel fold metal-dependent hydrolase